MAARDRDAARAYQREWARERRALNPVLARERGRDRYRREVLLTRLRNRLRKAFVAFSVSGKQAASSEYADFMAIIRHLGPCPGPLGEWEIDHIKPLCSFDFSDPEQVRAAFHPTNHQWLTAEQNRRKHAKES
ncbi:HNH endonuclease signature motif containing protein [Xenophilus sp. Marseille-Q4582]|uniref:HNH endonuclease signature motif containing protein n=1 Tax=Xenophilus sp. Marseille-Q4582 TaxID=2866600 RepID=UPI001CE47A4D|nr:HNH endonuclease signature motif containing protein [Xenophilus sp. Marseille-Q4582]